MKFLKQATYIRYVLAKLLKFIQITMQTFRGFFENWKGPGTSFQVTFFVEYFGKNVSVLILHKLAQFRYQAVFTFPKVGIWWRNDIWISEKSKFDYLQNEKYNTKHFSLFHKCSPLDLKKTN